MVSIPTRRFIYISAKKSIMNELFYEVTGTELLVLHQDKPDSTYVKLVLASPARNKYGIGASFYA